MRQIFTTTTVVLYGRAIHRIAKTVATIRVVAVAPIPVILPRTRVVIRSVTPVRPPQAVLVTVEVAPRVRQRSQIITHQDQRLVIPRRVRMVAIMIVTAVRQRAGRRAIPV